MGKVLKFAGHLTGVVGGFITGGPEGALASLKLSLAMLTGNPFIIAAAVAADAYQTFASHGGSKVSPGAPSVFRQSIADSFIIYGRRRVGGLLTFFHARKSGKQHFRYFVIAAAGHHIQGNPTWMLGDEAVTVDGSGKVTSGAYANAAWLWLQLGEDSETANATFVSECDGKWTSAHKGNGVAAIYAKFKMTDAVVQAGMPNITAVVDGKDDILDPRDDSTGYSNNAALVFYDWMKLPREEGGFGAYEDEIADDDWISAQANVCDEVIEGEARYAIDAVIVTGATPSEVRDALVVNCAGTYTYSEGRHLLRVGYWVPPTETLEEVDLAGPIRVSPFLTSDAAANEVQGTFIDPGAGFQPAPFATRSIVPAPSDIRQADISFAFITSKYRAERVANIMLGRAQCEKSVTWPMNIAGLATGALDMVQLGTERYGLSNYSWVIANWALSADFGVSLNVREEKEEIYADPAPVTPDTVPTIAVAEPTFGIPRDAPDVADWAAIGDSLASPGGAIPAIVITGEAPDQDGLTGVQFDYRTAPGSIALEGEAAGWLLWEDGYRILLEDDPPGPWIGAMMDAPDVVEKEIVSVTPGTAYEVSIRYVNRAGMSDRLILGPVTVGVLLPAESVSIGGTFDFAKMTELESRIAALE